MIDIFIPTYNRKELKCLSLSNKDIRLNLCVRHSSIKNDFYDFCKDMPNVNLLDIGEPADIGETRQAILEYCYKNNIQYCIMLDDTVSNIYSTDKYRSITECLNNIINYMHTNEYSELSAIFALSTENRKHHAFINNGYFYHCPVQGFVINVPLVFKHNISFKSLKICGSEDMAFFIDTIKAGLITCTNTNINMIVDTPMKKKKGGTHNNHSLSVEQRNDIMTSQLRQYAGNMYGVYFTKRYRHQIEEDVCFTAFDYDYFIDVLIKYRHENKKIIDSQFKVKEECYNEI